jgi:hypothetical protein
MPSGRCRAASARRSKACSPSRSRRWRLRSGRRRGACLRRIAAHAHEAHSFDLEPPTLSLPDNVTVHTGDSHELLPEFLAELTRQGRRVDFVMVDGDHSPEGIRRDLEDLLDSDAVARAVILFHDVANERVRQGIEAVGFEEWPKVVRVELDWIAGKLFAEPAPRNELWGGIGLVVVDDSTTVDANRSVYEQRYHPAGPLLARVRDLLVADTNPRSLTQSPRRWPESSPRHCRAKPSSEPNWSPSRTGSPELNERSRTSRAR